MIVSCIQQNPLNLSKKFENCLWKTKYRYPATRLDWLLHFCQLNYFFPGIFLSQRKPGPRKHFLRQVLPFRFQSENVKPTLLGEEMKKSFDRPDLCIFSRILEYMKNPCKYVLRFSNCFTQICFELDQMNWEQVVKLKRKSIWPC